MAQYVNFWFSPVLISAGQGLAAYLFLTWHESEIFADRPVRLLYLGAFALLQTVFQGIQGMSIMRSGGFLAVTGYLLLSFAFYLVFVKLWAGLAWRVTYFLALILLLTDYSVWPLLSTIIRSLSGNVNYIYEGPLAMRPPFLALLTVAECGILLGIRRLLPDFDKIRVEWYDVLLMVAFAIPFVCIRSLSTDLPMESLRTAVCSLCFLAGLVLVASGIARSTAEADRLRLAQMERVMEQQQQQFLLRKQSIDEVNRKYHDMKNILLYLQAEGRQSAEHEVQEIMEKLKPYESVVDTGNEAVNIVLGDKLKICAEHGIDCVPYVDGRMLDFIAPLDLCTIFGNAMDNAIEGCLELPDAKERQISIHLTKRAGTLVLTFRNTFGREVSFQDGLPVTTKKDKENHGYGVENMKRIAERYGGFLSCRAENQEFVLTILFPQEEA